MTNVYETGTIWSTTLPAGQRTYYESLLLETLRMKSILVPFTIMKEDFSARDTGTINYTEVFDLEPDWSPLSETNIWLQGAQLDSRSINITLEIHGDTIKMSDYNELVNYWNRGDLRGLVKGKLGQSQVDYLDILCRNAYFDVHANYTTFVEGRADRFALLQADVFDPDQAEVARIHLEEREIPGVIAVADEDVQTIVCVTTPRVIHDIRLAVGSAWLDVQNYNATGRKFTREAGMWGGVRFVRTNRFHLKNYGLVEYQTPLNGATVAGQGAATTVDTVYSVGQAGATANILVDDSSSFSVGDVVTIHDNGDSASDGGGNFAPNWSDGTQETRRIVAIGDGTHVSFDRPLLKVHGDNDWMTVGRDIHASVFIGGPTIVYGVGERPHPIILPKIDDLAMIQRFSWRGFLKMQMFRPEWMELMWSGGSVT